MNDDLVTLIAGAVVGFLSAVSLELVRNRIANKRQQKERVLEAKDEKEKNIREFLSVPGNKSISPSWLTLIKTGGNSLPFFQNIQTKDGMAMNLSEALPQENPDTPTKPTIEKFLLTQTQIIGRQEDCEVRLMDATVSRLHAMIRHEDGCFVIYDLASRSGSYVNSTRVGKNGIALQAGDRIKVGDSVFIFDGYSGSTKDANEDRKKDAVITKPPRSLKSDRRRNSDGKS